MCVREHGGACLDEERRGGRRGLRPEPRGASTAVPRRGLRLGGRRGYTPEVFKTDSLEKYMM